MQYSTAEDKAAEDRIAREIETLHPGYKMNRYSEFDRVDYWVEYRGRLVAYIETKDRKVASTTYPTVYLSFQKWLALFMSWMTSEISTYYVVGYTDRRLFIDIRDVDSRKTTIAGRFDRGNAINAREPIIEVPISELRPLAGLFGKTLATPVPFTPRTPSKGDEMADIFEHDSDAPWHMRRDGH